MSNRALIEEAFERCTQLTSEELSALVPMIDSSLAALERGELRAARAQDGKWISHAFVKKLILLSFLIRENAVGETNPGCPKNYDKLPLKFEQWDDAAFRDARIRVVPGAVVRAGAYIAPGGVLEPIGDNPVAIEDNVFIGARSEVAEGVIMHNGAVIGIGVYLGASTPIIDRASGEVYFGEVPANAVVIAGNHADPKLPGVSLACAVIVKYVDERTRSKTALNDLVRELSL